MTLTRQKIQATEIQYDFIEQILVNTPREINGAVGSKAQSKSYKKNPEKCSKNRYFSGFEEGLEHVMHFIEILVLVVIDIILLHCLVFFSPCS